MAIVCMGFESAADDLADIFVQLVATRAKGG